MPYIEVENLTKTFTVAERPDGKLSALRGAFKRTKRIVTALDGVSFAVGQGELVGYIGPNGAGKSTSVKIMSGILHPDSGRCVIAGRTPWRERAAHVATLGVVFGQRSQLWWDVPVGDSFDLLRVMYGVGKQRHAARREELCAVLDIGGLLATPARQLSLGQRMRCELAAALLHYPSLLFLDEPTIGLDASAKLALRDFLRKINREEGVTMILTTHDMDDIGALCEHVMVIGHGKILFNGGLAELKTAYAPLRIVRARMVSDVRPDSPSAEDYNIPGAERTEWRDGGVTVYFNPAVIAAHEMVARVAELLPVGDISVGEQDIDVITASMYEKLAL